MRDRMIERGRELDTGRLGLGLAGSIVFVAIGVFMVVNGNWLFSAMGIVLFGCSAVGFSFIFFQS